MRALLVVMLLVGGCALQQRVEPQPIQAQSHVDGLEVVDSESVDHGRDDSIGRRSADETHELFLSRGGRTVWFLIEVYPSAEHAEQVWRQKDPYAVSGSVGHSAVENRIFTKAVPVEQQVGYLFSVSEIWLYEGACTAYMVDLSVEDLSEARSFPNPETTAFVSIVDDGFSEILPEFLGEKCHRDLDD